MTDAASRSEGRAAGPGRATALVRTAVDADLPVVAALRRAWVEELSGPVDDPGTDGDTFEAGFATWWRQEAGQRTTWLAVVEAAAGAAAVGMLNLKEFRRMPRPDRPPQAWGYVGNVFVLAAHRDTGIGTQLLDEATAEADRRGYVRLVLSPSVRSVPFYRRAGFVDAGADLLVRPHG